MHIKSCKELRLEMERPQVTAEKICFKGVEGNDVYNTTPDFTWDGEHWIIGRVEPRDSEISCVRIFRRISSNIYEAAYPEVVFERFQDPFVTKVGDEIVVGGIQIDTNPLDTYDIINWRTCFFRGKHLDSLRLFACAPNRMKDVRLAEMQDGRIALFTRPIVGNPEKGRIGFTVVDSLDQVTEKAMETAPISYTHFTPMEWGGVNEIHPLPDGKLGILGHISCRDELGLHYHVMTFIHDPLTNTHTPIKMLLTRDMLPAGEYKRPELQDVLFAGGLARHSDHTATLYTGVSDCETWCVVIADPFAE